ncbi:calpain-A isoform X3 [Dendroctonus ponderosae]|uniref:calpain-A isoform X3 n=1 Tax=Dendroctonus ponderosae TaxID=77166 RepID=UPI002035682A|nr:calpain-A isoform X3 [Dendroctonus ponderosae]
MWDALLNRSCQSCEGFGTPKTSFAKRKLDINSIEYQSYIRRDVLGFLDKYPKPSRMSKEKRWSISSSKYAGYANRTAIDGKIDKTKKADLKYKPVYLRVDRAREEGEKYPANKPQERCVRINAKKEECGCSKVNRKVSRITKGNEKDKPERSLIVFENSGVKCPVGYCDLEKRKRGGSENRKKSPDSLKTREAEVNPQEKIAVRHPILILRKKYVKRKDGSIPALMPDGPSVLDVNKQMQLGKEKLYMFGEKGSGFKARAGPQDFYQLRDENLERGTLFEDPEFPATDSSLFFSQRPDRYYEWKRPHEICDNPQFFVEGYSRFDVQQGELGDCWLLAAAANLTLYHRLFLQIVPDDQDFDDKYAGIFHFRFWQYGRWIDVVIDDRLPTYRGQLVFLHSTEENEFWSALIEKAYAKMHGSYEALKGGSTCEAMEDFTGGVTEMYELESSPPNLFQIMIKAYERASLMGCSIEPDPNILEAQTPEGLVRGHAYSITRVQYVDIQTPNVTGKIPLLRLRNPWGNESEWNGAWGDGSPEWRFISESEKEELGLTFDNDGEFWMAFKDFQQHFSRVEICNLNPDSLSEEELREGNKKKWEMSVYEGEWVRGVTAGGCRNFIDTFWNNPQYRITLTEVDEDDDEGNCTLIVALMQKNRRQIRSTGGDLLTIGFAIYHLPYPDRVPKPLDLQFFKYNASVARSPSFINLREVSCRFKLPPGTYCIVPSTFDPNEEGEFLLRVFSENQNNMEENDQQIGYGELDEKVVHLSSIVSELAPMPDPVNEPPIQKSVRNLAEVVEVEPSAEEQEETDKVYEVFLKLAGEDKEVDWKELKEILDYSMQDALTRDGFSKDICRSMIAMMDVDKSGKLGYEEFKSLWQSLRDWKNVWSLYDTDKSGTFSGFELRQALQSAGYRLNNRVLNVLMHRFGNKMGEVHFDDFMMCAMKTKTMIDCFKAKDKTGINTATFSLEEWLESTLYS